MFPWKNKQYIRPILLNVYFKNRLYIVNEFMEKIGIVFVVNNLCLRWKLNNVYTFPLCRMLGVLQPNCFYRIKR